MIEQFEAIFRFQNHLLGLGIPINGIVKTEGGFEIDFKDEATVLQRTLAEAEKATFDFRIRKRTLSALRTWYANLSSTDKNKLIGACAIQYALDHPDVVEGLGLTLPYELDSGLSLLRSGK